MRRRRNAIDAARLPANDALALRAFFAFERARPWSRMILVTATIGDAPSAVGDLTMVVSPYVRDEFRRVVDRLSAAGWLGPGRRYSAGVWLRGLAPPPAAALGADVRLFQRRGGVVFGWEPDDPFTDEPKAAAAAPAVSASTFPSKRQP